MNETEHEKFMTSLRHCLSVYGVSESFFIGMASRAPTGEKYITFEEKDFESLYDIVSVYISKSKRGATLYWRKYPEPDRPRVRILISSSALDVDVVKGKA